MLPTSDRRQIRQWRGVKCGAPGSAGGLRQKPKCGERDFRLTQIVTANRLIDGIVVFQDEAGGWSEDFARAAAHEDAAAALARASQDVAASLVVDPYAIEVELRNGHYAPKALREAIRATGPTVRRDLGKQAEGLAPIAAVHAPTEKSHVSL
jgi:hypothetical protein